MIKLPEERTTDYRRVEATIAGLRTRAAVRNFYEGFIERHEKLNSEYLFSESFDRDFVFEQIDTQWPNRDRELFGIPFGVKDVFNTKVLPTAMGSEIWKGFKAGNNARVVDEIADRGGIVFSKVTTAEFAVHYIPAGKTLNPHNPNHLTGTSSAGSAVAVACGALPICLGTQTAGSIVRPASYCGSFGFKPSFGAFDRTGTLKTTDTLDTIGLIGSDIYGLRKAFTAAFQKDPQYPGAKNYFTKLKSYRLKERVTLGIIAEQFNGYGNYDSYVKHDFGSVADCLTGLEIQLSEVERVDFVNEIHLLHQRIYSKSLSYYFQEEVSRGTGMSDVMRQMIALGDQIAVEDYVDAVKRQSDCRTRFDAIIKDYDFLITPSTASVAPLIGDPERDDTCLVWTFLGYPVLSIPAFWSAEHDLPFGLQIVAPKFCDLALLEFGEKVVGHLRRSCQERSVVSLAERSILRA